MDTGRGFGLRFGLPDYVACGRIHSRVIRGELRADDDQLLFVRATPSCGVLVRTPVVPCPACRCDSHLPWHPKRDRRECLRKCYTNTSWRSSAGQVLSPRRKDNHATSVTCSELAADYTDYAAVSYTHLTLPTS